jgi:hypothetical protein
MFCSWRRLRRFETHDERDLHRYILASDNEFSHSYTTEEKKKGETEPSESEGSNVHWEQHKLELTDKWPVQPEQSPQIPRFAEFKTDGYWDCYNCF